MGRNSSHQQEAMNPLSSPSVVGLEAGRELARRNQRRRRMRDSATSVISALVGIAVLIAAVSIGYTIYEEQQTNDRAESELRRAELERERSGDDIHDAIDELEDQPIWNGPGNPSFGVGDGG